MSGGYFDYNQYKIGYIADDIERMIRNHESSLSFESGFSTDTIDEFKKAVKVLRLAQIYAQRIDWLVSGDDGEQTFHEHLAKDTLLLFDMRSDITVDGED